MLGSIAPIAFFSRHPDARSIFLLTCVLSLTFALAVWLLRAATPAAAFFGGVVCQIVTFWTWDARQTILHSGLTPLMLLFVLTFVATRTGKRHRPELISASEARRGRTASQIIANLGAAAFFWAYPAGLLGALAEATADTVSSELGQAFGGTPYLLTTLRPAAAGTDGAISLLGTVAGILSAVLVTGAGAWAMHLSPRQSGAALAGGTAGLFFDSLLGATVERCGWLGNDLVNLFSTVFAAVVTLLLLSH